MFFWVLSCEMPKTTHHKGIVCAIGLESRLVGKYVSGHALSFHSCIPADPCDSHSNPCYKLGGGRNINKPVNAVSTKEV